MIAFKYYNFCHGVNPFKNRFMMRFISLNLQPDVSNFSLQSFLFSVLNPAVTEGNRNCFHRYHVQVWATVLMLFILRQGNGALRKSPRGLCFGESKK